MNTSARRAWTLTLPSLVALALTLLTFFGTSTGVPAATARGPVASAPRVTLAPPHRGDPGERLQPTEPLGWEQTLLEDDLDVEDRLAGLAADRLAPAPCAPRWTAGVAQPPQAPHGARRPALPRAPPAA
ncbi:MAG: hypothetical protein R3F62_11660 [Planctomycetota bacterium]